MELRVVPRGGVVDVGTSISISSSCPRNTKQTSFCFENQNISFYLHSFDWLIFRVIYVDKSLVYDLQELRNNPTFFSPLLCYLLVTGPTAWPFSIKLFRRSRSFNFATSTPVFCKA